MDATVTLKNLAGFWFARRLTAFVVSVLFRNVAFAQTPAGPAASLSSATETVELSPFVVTTDKENGYAAKETLAGTRMRMDLRDVGASLTILTPEFLRDLGVNSFDHALL